MNLIIAAGSGGVTDILRETAETFGWNWKLFLSQVISFCIVAYLLQRFAYKPILAVLEERRRKIEEGQINAEKIKKALAHERTMESLKRELGRLVVDTTAKVTGKVLTQEDQRRLQEEAAREVV